MYAGAGKRTKEGLKMLSVAKKSWGIKSKNKVFPTIDEIGTIHAYVFSEKGIVLATPFRDDEQKSKKYITSLAYPDLDRILEYYSLQTGNDIDKISMTDDNFIKFVIKLFSMKDRGSELLEVGWTFATSGMSGKYYGSMQEAINSMYKSDVFCQQPEQEKKGRALS